LPILTWLDLRTDDAALERMKHPEESPYACLGPRSAQFGNDRLFLEDPTLRQKPSRVQKLAGPPDWRSDGKTLDPKVVELAQQFGYS